MSKKHDKRNQIRLTPRNEKTLREFLKGSKVPLTLTAFTNFIIEQHGIPDFMDSVGTEWFYKKGYEK